MAVIKMEGAQQEGKTQSSKKKTLYIVLIVVLNIVTFTIIYMTFFSSGGSPAPAPPSETFAVTPVVGSGAGTSPVFDSTESFQRFINQLNQDLKILDDPKYQLLRSLGVKISVATSGRDNPFVSY